MVSSKDAWDYDPPLGAPTHGKKKKLKKHLIFWVSPLKQARLETASICLQLTIKHKNSWEEKDKGKYIEDITRWREDMSYIFERQNSILRTSAASE